MKSNASFLCLYFQSNFITCNFCRTSSSDEEIVKADGDFIFDKTGRDPAGITTFIFNRPFGPKCEVDISDPLKIFLIFMSPILDLIVHQSNLYAEQNGEKLDLTPEELSAFLGILILMGFHQLPSIRLYWSSNGNFLVTRIANVMSLKRFLHILRYLHLNDNTKLPKKGDKNFDKLFKVRPLLDILNEKFKSTFHPSRYLSIDESMIGFKGRSSLKQYLPLKPIKRGFKVWAITCAVTGFLLGLEVYQGKDNNNQAQAGTLGEKVVLGLSYAFQGFGYCLFFDRFFTTLPLLKQLLSVGLFGCGTLQSNRKFFPKDQLVNDNKMKFGEDDSVMSSDISVTKWKDRGKKSVIIASNMHNINDFTTINRRNKFGIKENVKCPKSVSDYNKYMGGVDMFDQFMGSYSISWKSRRWWIKIFYYSIDCVIVNSYILHRTTTNLSDNTTKPMTHLNFRSKLADQLIGDFCSRKSRGRKNSLITRSTKKMEG